MKINYIRKECSDFLSKSNNLPLIKPLKDNGLYIRKVKVRKKKKNNDFIKAFDAAFMDEYKNIRGRSLFCNVPDIEYKDGEEPFYIFPIDGFKFLYNPAVEASEKFIKSLELLDESTFIDTIKYSYELCSDGQFTLEDALQSRKEIIIYNIPYFYAIKKARYNNYYEVLDMLK